MGEQYKSILSLRRSRWPGRFNKGGDRVIRGGSWNEGTDDLHVFYRSWIGPDHSESEIGFRCERDTSPYRAWLHRELLD